MKKILSFILLLTVFFPAAYAQNTRIKDNNTIGWWAAFGTFNFNTKWGLHTEYQWRREDIITDWQQSLTRVGVNYRVNPKLSLRAGYAWIETFNYGDIPIQAAGKTFTEHRTYQMATLTDKISNADISHRFMLEQRWIGRYINPAASKEDDFFYVNRFRYMFRIQQSLIKAKKPGKELYGAIYDEVLLGFGKNVNENVFDQNRLGVLFGYRFSPAFRLEGGYFNQIVQLPREITGRNVFQYNAGVILNTYFTINLAQNKKK
jgi:Protein of unknown function (DUF2490)